MEPKKNRVVFKKVMNAKNKNNMKRHLHFYQLLLTIGLLVYATDLCANDSYVMNTLMVLVINYMMIQKLL